jgi:hypothetical protein
MLIYVDLRTDAREVDWFAWEHLDFLAVLAAGNYGARYDLPSTVTSPATAKNALTVGATLMAGTQPLPQGLDVFDIEVNSCMQSVHSLSGPPSMPGRSLCRKGYMSST